MIKREIDKRIYVSGVFGDYQVHNDMPGDAIVCHVSRAKLGHAIVRALRAVAYQENGVNLTGKRIAAAVAAQGRALQTARLYG